MTILTISEANARGISTLVKEAEQGRHTSLTRHGKNVAAIVSSDELQRLNDYEDDLRTMAVLVGRLLTDTGERVSLDSVIEYFGFTRQELESSGDEE